MADQDCQPREDATSAASTSQVPGAALSKKAARLLHRKVKVVVKDGRVLFGELNCLDKQGNLILINTYELQELNGRRHQKEMGQVLIPAAHRTSCELEAMPHEVEGLNEFLQQRA